MLYKVRINEKFGDREKYEPRRGYSFAPGCPGAICYKPQPIFSEESLKKLVTFRSINIRISDHVTKQKFTRC